MTTRLRRSDDSQRPTVEYGPAPRRDTAGVLGWVAMRGAGSITMWAPLACSFGACAALLSVACGSGAAPASPTSTTPSEPEPTATGADSPASGGESPGGQPPGTDAPAADSPIAASTPEPGADALVPGEYGGVYSVPVSAELEPYAAFEVESVRLDADGSGSELRLSYDLPELLLGEHRRISFRGSLAEGRYVLDGDDGVATCEPTGGGVRCDEVLSGVQPDADALERLLAGLPDAEANARRAVAEQFSIDPIGVLSISIAR